MGPPKIFQYCSSHELHKVLLETKRPAQSTFRAALRGLDEVHFLGFLTSALSDHVSNGMFIYVNKAKKQCITVA